MNGQSQGDDRLERLLTVWGDSRAGRVSANCLTLSQAARFADQGPADAAQADHVSGCAHCARLVGRFEQSAATDETAAKSAKSASRLWRWLPLAAAVVVAGAGVYMMLESSGQMGFSQQELSHLDKSKKSTPSMGATPPGAVATRPDDPEPLRVQLAELQKRFDKLQNDYVGDLATFNIALENLSELNEQQVGAAREQLAGLGEQITGLKAQLAKAQDDLKLARQDADTAKGKLTDLEKRAAELADAGDRLAAELRAAHDANVAGWVATGKTWRLMLGESKPAQIAAEPFAQMQRAARQLGLANQATHLSRQAADADTRRLIERIEAVLTRLDLANPNDAREQAWLAGVVGGDLVGDINAALADRDAPPAGPMLTFLVQTQTILLRGACAS